MNNLNLKPYEVRLIAHCLELASNEFSNHGCNDFDLTDKDLNLTDKEKRELTLNMAVENGDPEEIHEVRNGDTRDWASDWCVMSYFARILDGLKLPDAEPETEGAQVSRLTAQVVRLKDDLNKLHKRMGAAKDMVIQTARRL